ncbi:uncharacterized protein isoform X2 [Choristoneura fumiferana]|uniref:uncharacterized protein isoform X2 n=1 Tax=Choristoneura fumiferana TaxID=7141 RepID=UPI003D15430A
MDCCYVEEECEDYSVRPMLMVPCAPVKCRGEAPACFPCLPRCSKKVYCCEKPKSKPTVRSPAFSDEPDDDCCQPKKRSSRPRSSDDSYQSPQRQARCPPPPCYEPCCQPTCKPVKTKYVIPCYRYEDGRIERYVPTRLGRLPKSAYQRNGIQDQIHGYRGAIRYLCAGEGPEGSYVYTAVDPLRKIYSRVTQEMLPITKRKKSKNDPCA